MKVKKLSIGIKSLDEVMEDFARAAKALQMGENVAKREGLYFTDLRAFRLTFRRSGTRFLPPPLAGIPGSAVGEGRSGQAC